MRRKNHLRVQYVGVAIARQRPQCVSRQLRVVRDAFEHWGLGPAASSEQQGRHHHGRDTVFHVVPNPSMAERAVHRA